MSDIKTLREAAEMFRNQRGEHHGGWLTDESSAALAILCRREIERMEAAPALGVLSAEDKAWNAALTAFARELEPEMTHVSLDLIREILRSLRKGPSND